MSPVCVEINLHAMIVAIAQTPGNLISTQIVTEKNVPGTGVRRRDAGDAESRSELQHAATADEARLRAQSRGERTARGPEISRRPACQARDGRVEAYRAQLAAQVDA